MWNEFERYMHRFEFWSTCPFCGSKTKRASIRTVAKTGIGEISCKNLRCKFHYTIEGVEVPQELLEKDEKPKHDIEKKYCRFCDRKCIRQVNNTVIRSIDSCPTRARELLKRKLLKGHITPEQHEMELQEINNWQMEMPTRNHGAALSRLTFETALTREMRADQRAERKAGKTLTEAWKDKRERDAVIRKIYADVQARRMKMEAGDRDSDNARYVACLVTEMNDLIEKDMTPAIAAIG